MHSARIKFIASLFILFANFLFSQSVHEYFFNQSKKQIGKNSSVQNSFIIPCSKKEKELSATVFGFLPDWEYVSDSKKYLRLDLLTHVAVFGFVADSSGELTNPMAWPWNDLITAAHENNVKVIMTVISFNGQITHKLLTDENVRNTLFGNIQNIIQSNNLDGVNLDFENVYESDRGELLNSFVSELNNYLDASLEVSFDSPAWNWGGWDFGGLANACDYLFIMEYDYFGHWSEQSGPTAPLTGNNANITRSITEQYSAVPSNKIIMGVPYYGIHWKTENNGEGAPTTNFLDYLTYRNARAGFGWSAPKWSENYSVSWTEWNEDSVHQLWFDDVASLEAKYDFAISQNLKGVGIWALGFDGRRTELWDLIDKKFGSGKEIAPQPPLCFSVDAVNNSGEIYAKLEFSKSENADYYLIYSSSDGINFTDSVQTTDTLVYLPRTDLTEGEFKSRYYKVVAVNSGGKSLSTNALACNSVTAQNENSPRVLVIDGFDRYYGNNNSFNYVTFIAPVFDELEIPFASANNERVIKNPNDDFISVYWILGNESRITETLNFFEQNYLKNKIENATPENYFRLFISGTELGYDLADEDYANGFDEEFYSGILHAEYISDAPANNPYTYFDVENIEGSAIDYDGVFSYDDGTHGTFDVGYPDAIKSNVADSLDDLIYVGVSAENGYAGISFSDENYKLVYFGFPVETIFNYYKRLSFLQTAYDFLNRKPNDVETENDLPAAFELKQNYPNPFNPTTTITYVIASEATRLCLRRTVGNSALAYNEIDCHAPLRSARNDSEINVSLKVYDALGREVATLVNAKQTPGKYSVRFNAFGLPTGIYFYTLRAGNFIRTRKMLLLK